MCFGVFLASSRSCVGVGVAEVCICPSSSVSAPVPGQMRSGFFLHFQVRINRKVQPQQEPARGQELTLVMICESPYASYVKQGPNVVCFVPAHLVLKALTA
eukprot:jgi/Botrbrau1/6004/Bobra.104_1s0032.1